MTQKRMFSNLIIDNDRFLDLPASAQALYFHLGLQADDDGFVGSPKKTVRSVNCTPDDLNALIENGFLIAFDSGVVALTHWRAHNGISKDRYTKTVYQKEFAQLGIEDKTYTLSPVTPEDADCLQNGNKADTDCVQAVPVLCPQNRREENRREEKRKEEKRKDSLSTDVDARDVTDEAVIDLFNEVCPSLPKVKKLTDKRRRAIKKAKKQLGAGGFAELFAKAEASDFLKGNRGNWNGCDFDWIIQPVNINKILNGKYDDRAYSPPAAPRQNASYDINELEKIDTLDFID